MKLSFSSVLLSVVLGSTLVSAAPHAVRAAGKKSGAKVMSNQNNNVKGAAYFITNEPDGNHVVSAGIDNDGKLTLRLAVNAVGNGAHGKTSPNGPDPLFSQGAIKASPAAKMLATVNAGSNTVSAFSIDPNDPAMIKRVGNPQSSGGEFPMSLAFNKAGTQLCTLNGGAVNGVSCFKVDQKTGLTPQEDGSRSLGLKQTTPATGPAGSASHILFSEDGTKLIASIKGTPPNDIGFLALWDVAKDGGLSKDFKKVTPEKGGLLPFSMTNIPGKNALLATDAALGFDIFDLSDVEKKAGNATKNSANEIKGQAATCWSSFSEKTGTFFLTDIGTATVTEVSVDDNLKTKIVKQYPQTKGSGTIDNDIAVVGNKNILYVLAANATSIDVLDLPSAGNAKNIQKLDIAGPAKKVGLTINPNNIQGMTTFVKQ